MIIRFKKYSKTLYIFFLFLSLVLFFFSTDKVKAKSFSIDNIEISRPFEINFDKNIVVDDGFIKAFSELISKITISSDHKVANDIKLSQIKGMIESFTIKEEKFINDIYYVNLGVSFNKKKIFKFLENKNIFPSIPTKKNFLFIPIIIDENKKNLSIFSDNKLFIEWNNYNENYHLIEYVLPTEDLEDLNLIKKNYDTIEQYDFKEITNKYNLNESIVALIFKNKKGIRILSKIAVNDNIVLKNLTFSDIDFDNENDRKELISRLKIVYDDYWKNLNKVNTSIKLSIYIKMKSNDNLKVSNFEKTLDEMNLVYEYSILKYDKDFVYYQITFNGTPNNFLDLMKNKDFDLNTQNKTWFLK